MRGRLRRAVGAVAVAVAVVAGVLLLAEAALRLRGEPLPTWPADPSGAIPGIRMDPVLGPALEPGWSGRWYAWFDVEADTHGFRSTGLAPPPAPRHRIAFLGDSCTFGWGIDTPDTFVARLDARQRGAGADMELLDAAYPGESAVVGRWVLEARVLPLRPDVIVAAFSANNAFRLSLVSDAERFRLVRARRVLFRSHLVWRAVAWLARRAPPAPDPRDREALGSRPLASLRRVASAAEFDAAIRAIVRASRQARAAVVLVVLPRAVELFRNPEYDVEDAARTRAPEAALATPPTQPASPAALAALEASCLDHRSLADPLAELRARRPGWRPVYPDADGVVQRLRQGARAYVAGRPAKAERRFADALTLDPTSPLTLYDLGVARLARGDDAGGLAALDEADRRACNVFLQYQVILWHVARALDVPIIDVTLHFQARGAEKLVYDPAHPNALGHGVIADALWPVLAKLTGS